MPALPANEAFEKREPEIRDRIKSKNKITGVFFTSEFEAKKIKKIDMWL